MESYTIWNNPRNVNFLTPINVTSTQPKFVVWRESSYNDYLQAGCQSLININLKAFYNYVS